MILRTKSDVKSAHPQSAHRLNNKELKVAKITKHSKLDFIRLNNKELKGIRGIRSVVLFTVLITKN